MQGLREQRLCAPPVSGDTTFLRAKTANKVLNAQERRIRFAELKGEFVDRAREETLTFRLAREARDAWVTWPSRVATPMAAELTSHPGEDHGRGGADAEGSGSPCPGPGRVVSRKSEPITPARRRARTRLPPQVAMRQWEGGFFVSQAAKRAGMHL